MFNFFKPININEKVAEFKETQGAVLLDVRTTEEYNDGHIENSINIPVDQMNKIKDVAKDTNTPIFIYCHSGGRAIYAVEELKKMGYSMVVNSGGIMSYSGKAVR